MGIRKPVAAFEGKAGAIVVCDDGTFWGYRTDKGAWEEVLPPIPGSSAASQGNAPKAGDFDSFRK